MHGSSYARLIYVNLSFWVCIREDGEGVRTRDRSVAGLELFDHGAILGLPDEVAGDEAGGAVDLRRKIEKGGSALWSDEGGGDDQGPSLL
jgi:hypothetical protein